MPTNHQKADMSNDPIPPLTDLERLQYAYLMVEAMMSMYSVNDDLIAYLERMFSDNEQEALKVEAVARVRRRQDISRRIAQAKLKDAQ